MINARHLRDITKHLFCRCVDVLLN